MKQKSLDTNSNITLALETYSDMVRRICFLYFQNSADVDDVFQEVFLKLLQNKIPFESPEHEKAWLIRVTINKCKDILKSFWRKNIDTIENLELPFEDEAENELLKVVLTLPEKYMEVIYLYYYEGYSVPEMAKMLGKSEGTLYSNLSRARALIKQKLGGKESDYTF
ncbi:MAG: RNA polymerase sigma factor [Solirubrobacterales bacterium]